MYTRRGLFLGLLAAGLLPAQDAQPSVQVTGAVKLALTLSAEDLAQGRFRLVVPKDKPGARSVRMLTRLEVVQLRK